MCMRAMCVCLRALHTCHMLMFQVLASLKLEHHTSDAPSLFLLSAMTEPKSKPRQGWRNLTCSKEALADGEKGGESSQKRKRTGTVGDIDATSADLLPAEDVSASPTAQGSIGKGKGKGHRRRKRKHRRRIMPPNSRPRMKTLNPFSCASSNSL